MSQAGGTALAAGALVALTGGLGAVGGGGVGLGLLANELANTTVDSLPRLEKRNIINTYVWTADGGLFAETQETMDVWQETTGGSFNASAKAGLSLSADIAISKVAFQFELEAMVGAVSTGEPGDFAAEVRASAVKDTQAIVFQQQLDLAAELGLNVVFHERDAWADTLELLRPYSGRVRGVFHCFGKPPEQMQEVLDLGHLVSFTGIVTFKNGTAAQDSARAVPADRFMVETDCPFLSPAPHRGKRCEPGYTRLIAENVAVLRGRTLAEIAAQTTATTEGFFRFGR